MTKRNLEENEKKQCHCEDCKCDDNKDSCQCEHCECDYDHNSDDCKCEHCECDEDGCECEDCNCDEKDPQEYIETLQRLQAEFDNYRKRNEFIVLKAKEEGIILTVEKLLPVLDTFKSAEKHISEKELKGLNLVKEQLLSALKLIGVIQIDAINKPFNPDFHNAIMMDEQKDVESGIILEVFQDGYMYKDKIIRHSMVKVNK